MFDVQFAAVTYIIVLPKVKRRTMLLDIEVLIVLSHSKQMGNLMALN